MSIYNVYLCTNRNFRSGSNTSTIQCTYSYTCSSPITQGVTLYLSKEITFPRVFYRTEFIHARNFAIQSYSSADEEGYFLHQGKVSYTAPHSNILQFPAQHWKIKWHCKINLTNIFYILCTIKCGLMILLEYHSLKRFK